MKNNNRWFRLDNSAKLYPAISNRHWTNMFRHSATLYEDVDIEILNQALKNTVPRFPSIAARIARGLFWYYVQPLKEAPDIMKEYCHPMTYMSLREIRKCAIRVIVYKKRIAVEFFHSITDGTGGLIFLKSLVAEYLELKHNISIPCECGILSRDENPKHYELEDAYLKVSSPAKDNSKEENAWEVLGTPEQDGFLNITNFQMSSQKLLDLAHEYDVSLNTMLVAILMKAILNLQFDLVKNPKKLKPIKIFVPVNLRPLFDSRTLRNFILYILPEIDPKMGDYTLEEIVKIVHHKIGLCYTKKYMSKMIQTNIETEKSMVIRLIPLFLKNIVMNLVWRSVGKKTLTLSFSNIGVVKLPEIMQPYVEKMDFILNPQATAPYNATAYTFNGTLNLTFTRNIKEARIESYFFRELQRLGIEATVQSNQR